MTVLTESVRKRIEERFADGLAEPVLLRLFVTPAPKGLVLPPGLGCATCRVTRELLEDIQKTAPDRIALEVVDVVADPDRARAAGVDAVPSLLIGRPDEDARIRFQGLPDGYEFSTIIDAIERVSRREHGLNDANLGRLSELMSPVEIMVFVTPTCPYCPAAASLAYRLALASPQIRAIVVEANEFPDLSERFEVRGVPRTVVNQSGGFVGALPEDDFVDAVIQLATPAAAQAV